MTQRILVSKTNSSAYPSSSSFFSDGFDYSACHYQRGEAVRDAHKDGYDFVRLDGSATWHAVPTGRIAALRVVSGKTPAVFVTQEAVFRECIDK